MYYTKSILTMKKMMILSIVACSLLFLASCGKGKCYTCTVSSNITGGTSEATVNICDGAATTTAKTKTEIDGVYSETESTATVTISGSHKKYVKELEEDGYTCNAQ